MVNKKLWIILGGLVVMLVVVITATFAWFIVGRTAATQAVDITAETTGSLQIAKGLVTVDSPNFGSTATYDDNLLQNFTKKEITGNGEDASMFAWTGNKTAGTGVPTVYTDAVSGQDYIDQNFTFKADSNLDVYLSKDSSISDVTAGKSLSGAARVAICEYVGGVCENPLVWAPNTKQITSGQASGLVNYINDKVAKTTAQYTAYTSVGFPASADSTAGSSNGKIASITGASAGDPKITTIRVRIWLEGTDEDASIANLTGQSGTWRTLLSFVAFDK